jgi:hypothetical protein
MSPTYTSLAIIARAPVNGPRVSYLSIELWTWLPVDTAAGAARYISSGDRPVARRRIVKLACLDDNGGKTWLRSYPVVHVWFSRDGTECYIYSRHAVDDDGQRLIGVMVYDMRTLIRVLHAPSTAVESDAPSSSVSSSSVSKSVAQNQLYSSLIPSVPWYHPNDSDDKWQSASMWTRVSSRLAHETMVHQFTSNVYDRVCIVTYIPSFIPSFHPSITYLCTMLRLFVMSNISTI